MTGDVSPYEVHPIDAVVARRCAEAKTTAWLLWLFLGGVWANVAYLNPKHRTLIIILGVAGLFLTLGLSGVVGILVGWVFNLDRSGIEAEIRREEEERYLRAQQIGGA